MSSNLTLPQSKGYRISLTLKIILISLGIIFSFSLLEIYSRIAFKITLPRECFQNDILLNHSHKPSSSCQFRTKFWYVNYKINSFGLRDFEYPQKKPENTYRILALGDSFTEGFGVKQKESWPKILEKNLTSNIKDKHIEVINAGVAGYSPLLEYLYLKEKGLELEPDLVIVAFDLTDFLDDIEYAKQANYLANEPVSVKPFEPLHQQIYLDHLENGEQTPNTQKIISFLRKHSMLLKTLLGPKPQALRISNFFQPTENQQQEVKKNILLIKTLLEQKNVNLLLVTYPYQNQLEDQNIPKPQQELENFALTNDIKFLNATPNFSSFKPQDLYIKYDLHFSVKGHNILAQSLTNYLIENNQLKQTNLKMLRLPNEIPPK